MDFQHAQTLSYLVFKFGKYTKQKLQPVFRHNGELITADFYKLSSEHSDDIAIYEQTNSRLEYDLAYSTQSEIYSPFNAALILKNKFIGGDNFGSNFKFNSWIGHEPELLELLIDITNETDFDTTTAIGSSIYDVTSFPTKELKLKFMHISDQDNFEPVTLISEN